MSDRPVKRTDLKGILLEDLLEMSEQDFKEELKNRGLTTEDLARRFDVALEKATALALKRLYQQAREEGAGEQTLTPVNVTAAVARVALGRLNEANVPFLLAARKGRPLNELPDAEVESLARDLLELGLIKPEDLT